jgi:hypothetical protein
MEPDRPQHDRSVAFVITQQYSSATFVSLYFRTHEEKLWACFGSVIISFFLTFLKLRISETA